MAVGASAEAAGPRASGTSWRARTREGRFALALLAPSIIVVFGIVIYPILKTLYTSLYSVDTPFPGHFPWVGLRNYTFALSQSEFWSAVERTAYFTVVSTGLELVFGMAIALLLIAPLRARWLFRTIDRAAVGAARRSSTAPCGATSSTRSTASSTRRSPSSGSSRRTTPG